MNELTDKEIWGESTVSRNSLKTGECSVTPLGWHLNDVANQAAHTADGAATHWMLRGSSGRAQCRNQEKKQRKIGVRPQGACSLKFADRTSSTVTFLITACPGELLQCQNGADLSSLLSKFDYKDGLKREAGKCHIPCPPLAFDSHRERTFLLEASKLPILCGIKPEFLIHKFENVFSPNARTDLLRKWTDFMLTNPIAHNTKASSSSRSTVSNSYHLGFWRQYAAEPYISKDTRFDDNKEQEERCKNFLRAVQKEVAPKLRSLLQRYASEEWAAREKCVFANSLCSAPYC